MSVVTIVAAILGVIVSIAAVTAIVAGIVAKYRTEADERTLALWKGEAEAQKARADRLELQVSDLTRRVEYLESEKRGQIREEILSAFSQLPCQILRKDISSGD